MSSQDRIVEDLIRDKDDVKLQVLSERIFNIVGKVGERINSKTISNGQVDIRQLISSSEMNISHHPDEVSTTEESLCSNAKTSVREDTSKVTVTGTQEEADYPTRTMFLSLSLIQSMTTFQFLG